MKRRIMLLTFIAVMLLVLAACIRSNTYRPVLTGYVTDTADTTWLANLAGE